jgi:hypothetical protein
MLFPPATGKNPQFQKPNGATAALNRGALMAPSLRIVGCREVTVMKRFALLAVIAFALLAPTVAYGQGAKFVYRPEFKQWVVVPQAAPLAVQETPTPHDMIAKHEAMANAHRGGRMSHAAMHCDRIVAETRETLRKQS